MAGLFFPNQNPLDELGVTAPFANDYCRHCVYGGVRPESVFWCYHPFNGMAAKDIRGCGFFEGPLNKDFANA
jgi:hypothetical protein